MRWTRVHGNCSCKNNSNSITGPARISCRVAWASKAGGGVSPAGEPGQLSYQKMALATFIVILYRSTKSTLTNNHLLVIEKD